MNNILVTPDQSLAYRQGLKNMVKELLGGKKDPCELSEYELFEIICKIEISRRQAMQAAMYFECQLYMVDPGNSVFKNYTEEKKKTISETLERWKKEIAEAEVNAKGINPSF